MCDKEFFKVLYFLYTATILSHQHNTYYIYTHIYIYTYIYIYVCLLTYSMEQSPSWEANLFSAISAFYGTGRFITAVTSIRQLSLSRASWIQSIPSLPTSWRSILILSSHLRLSLPSGLIIYIYIYIYINSVTTRYRALLICVTRLRSLLK